MKHSSMMFQPELAIVDIGLPDLDGYELAPEPAAITVLVGRAVGLRGDHRATRQDGLELRRAFYKTGGHLRTAQLICVPIICATIHAKP